MARLANCIDARSRCATLWDERPDAVHDGVRAALAYCEAIFWVPEVNKRMRDETAHACRALCRARVAEEL